MTKQLIFQVYVGKKSALYDHCTNSVEAYCKEHNIDHVILTKPKLMVKPDPFNTGRSKEAVDRLGYLPIFEKEVAFEYFDDYDQVAIIDSDIWIRPGSPNIFNELPPEFDFGGVAERDMPITEQYARKIINYSQMQYGKLHGKVDFMPNRFGYEFFNMGMMVMNKSFQKHLKGMSPKDWITQPQFKDFVDGVGPWKWSTDQTLLNYFMKSSRVKVKNMDWKWNGLFTANTNITQCHFVHFFLKDKLPQKGENVEELMKHV